MLLVAALVRIGDLGKARRVARMTQGVPDGYVEWLIRRRAEIVAGAEAIRRRRAIPVGRMKRPHG